MQRRFQGRKRVSRLLLPVVAIAALALTACSGGGSTPSADSSGSSDAGASVDPTKPETTDVTASIFKATITAPLLTAEDNDYGLTLTPTYIESSPASVTALVGGSAQFAYTAYFGVIDAVNQGIKLRIVSEQAASAPGINTIEVLPDSKIKSLKDLVGKKVAIPALNSTNDAIIKYDMEQAGLDSSTVQFVALPYGEVAANLQQGTIDAGALLGAPLATAKSTLDTRTIFDFGDKNWKGFAQGGWITTQEFLDKNPNTVAAFQCAIAAGTKTVADDDAAYTTAMKSIGYDDAAIAGAGKPNFVTGLRTDAFETVAKVKAANDGGAPFDIESILVPAPDNC